MSNRKETTKNKALDYIREYVGREEVQIALDKARLHQEPLALVAPCLTDDVHDLLEEFGADRDLPEAWWMEEGDVDFWIQQLY